ncbi:MAG: hypothetical protein JST37_00915 [Bacteroidetes bacterium]|nr:hypothetical protein [Bacteroidota bacterium]MBS1980370.1 hypothetical protein [Bacteroidota bacterium]
MKTNKTIFVPIIAFAWMVMSCNKSSSPAQVSPSSAQTTFSNVNTDVAAAIQALNATPGNKALNSFTNLTNTANPLGRIGSFRSLKNINDTKAALSAGLASIRMMLLKSTASERVAGTTPFNFADKIGTYTWSKANHKWGYSPGGGIIKIDYPSDTTSFTNDTELQITAYTEVQVGSDYFPTSIETAIYQPISGAKQLGLSLTASGYDDLGNPNKASITFFVNPYSITFSFDNSQSLKASESFSFTKGSTTYIATGLSASYASATDQANGNPNQVTGYLQLENVKFNVTLDGTKAATTNDANQFAVIVITIDGGTAGHVVWVTDPKTGEQVPYVQYNDKTQQLLSDVFADLETQLNSLANG